MRERWGRGLGRPRRADHMLLSAVVSSRRGPPWPSYMHCGVSSIYYRIPWRVLYVGGVPREAQRRPESDRPPPRRAGPGPGGPRYRRYPRRGSRMTLPSVIWSLCGLCTRPFGRYDSLIRRTFDAQSTSPPPFSPALPRPLPPVTPSPLPAPRSRPRYGSWPSWCPSKSTST